PVELAQRPMADRRVQNQFISVCFRAHLHCRRLFGGNSSGHFKDLQDVSRISNSCPSRSEDSQRRLSLGELSAKIPRGTLEGKMDVQSRCDLRTSLTKGEARPSTIGSVEKIHRKQHRHSTPETASQSPHAV